MRLQIFGGMAGDKLVMEFVPWHPVDTVTKKLLPPSHDRFAVPGGGQTTEKSIDAWAKNVGYTVKRKHMPGEQNASYGNA